MSSSPARADRAFRPRDPASLAVVRAGFGSVMCFGALRALFTGKVEEHYIAPTFHFTYYGFDWLEPLPAPAMYALFWALAVLALFVALGFFHRWSAALFTLGFGYTFLLEKARYLNHYYLVILLGFLLAVVPAHAAFSLDARRRGGPRPVPAWSLFLLRTQLGLVYLFAGIAKLNPDWLRARPLVDWLAGRSEHPVLGSLFALEPTAWVFSYAGILLDLLAWPLLSIRATRLPTFLLLAAFHLTNAAVFDIGVFPWLMLAVTTVFFPPDWPRRLVSRKSSPLPEARLQPLPAPGPGVRRALIAFLWIYLAVQTLVPLRHWLYPGHVEWTEQGHMFSWRMKLRDKDAWATFLVKDAASGEHWLVDPRDELREWQARKMAGRPDMVLQFAHHLAERARENGRVGPIEVRATVLCSLNGRPARMLVDPAVDLARERRGLASSSWILPFEEHAPER